MFDEALYYPELNADEVDEFLLNQTEEDEVVISDFIPLTHQSCEDGDA